MPFSLNIMSLHKFPGLGIIKNLPIYGFIIKFAVTLIKYDQMNDKNTYRYIMSKAYKSFI